MDSLSLSLSQSPAVIEQFCSLEITTDKTVSVNQNEIHRQRYINSNFRLSFLVVGVSILSSFSPWYDFIDSEFVQECSVLACFRCVFVFRRLPGNISSVQILH